MRIRALRGERYVVETDGGTYVVDPKDSQCTCLDHAIRGKRCKHLRRVSAELLEGCVDSMGGGVCAACGVQVFRAVKRELTLCRECLLESGDLVFDRETGRTLVVVAVTDDRADEVTIDAASCTVANYPTNEMYGAQEPVVEAIYLADARSGDIRGRGEGDDRPRRYAFPITRLRRIPRDVDSSDAPDGDELVDGGWAGSSLAKDASNVLASP